MKRKVHIYILLGLLPLWAVSCQDWFDGALPKDKNLEEKQFSTELGTNAMLTGLYTSMEKSELYGSTLTFKELEMMAHYYYYTSGVSGTNPYDYYTAISNYDYTHERVKNKFADVWSNMYNAILQINIFIKNVEQTTVLSDAKRDLYLGEAYALRAYLHFDLFRLFSNLEGTQLIPYNTSHEIIPQKNVETVALFEQALQQDVNKARQLLVNDPIKSQSKILEIINNEDAGDVDSRERMYSYARNYRMNAYALNALEARMKLFFGHTTEAATLAQQVLNEAFGTDKPFFPVDPLKMGQNYTFHGEVLFGLYSMTLDSKWDDATKGELPGQVIAVGFDNLKGNIYKNDKVDSDISVWEDIRAKQWKPSGLQIYAYVSKKYTPSTDDYGRVSNNYSMLPLIRVSEMELILAEAKIEQKDYTGAMQALNDFRLRRGLQLGSLPVPADATETRVKSILETEYYKEFYGEGQVFYFLKRKGNTKIINAAKAGTVNMDKSKYTVPIPVAERIN